MATELLQFVRERAAGRCEYCRLPEGFTSVPFEIDPILSRKHGGATIASNLAMACWYCNSFKGSDIAGIDRGRGSSPVCIILEGTAGTGTFAGMVRAW